MINHCTSNPCLHNGLCIPLIDGYRCVCLDDYIGSTCEKTFDECSSNPCLNNGTCVDQIWNYTCQCPMGFTGSNCQTQIDYCLSAPCIKGLCLNKVGGRQRDFVRRAQLSLSLAGWIRLPVSIVVVRGRSLRSADQQMCLGSLFTRWHLHRRVA